jgi:hypothetical protein
MRPLRAVPANAAVLESGRRAGEAVSTTLGAMWAFGSIESTTEMRQF